ncbi:MAG TPA: SpoIIE family protein phosphatase [Bryobacteraceae bacterium]
MTLDLKSRWKRLGKLDKIFTVLLLLYLVLLLFAPGNVFTLLLQFLVIVLAAWIVLRLTRVALRKAIWRLRNRLLVAYMLIAVVPILLILTLAGIGTYFLAGQIAVYLVRSELDRRVAAMQSATDLIIRATPATRAETMRQTGELYRDRFPALALMVEENGRILRWPQNSEVQFPAASAGNISGVGMQEAHYFAWSQIVKDGTRCSAATPLTRRYLSEMVPDLGDVFLTEVSATPKQGASKGLQISTSTSKQASITVGDQQLNILPSGHDAPGAPLPPPVNRLDSDFWWFSLVPTTDWTDSARSVVGLLRVHTRYSAILQIVLSRKGDDRQSVLPLVLLAVSVAFLIVELIALIIGISLTRTITGAVHSLYHGTQRVMEGDFSNRITVSGRDQLADLARSFNTMTENLERLLAVAKEKERLQAELEIASEVQAQLYPRTIPIVRTLRVTGLCEPARMVSGDYYDYQNLSENRLAIAIGDVAGKGISAALLMATIQSAMRMELRSSLEMAAPSHVPRNGTRLSTARMVTELNQQLHATTAPEKFATFCIALYDDDSGVITYTNAGHLPPILIRNGDATRLDVNGTVVGAFPRSQYDESKIQLLSGDLLIWYTDGITEPENEYGEMFGEERLIELVAKHAASDDRKIIDTVMQAVRQWTGLPELSDDMTMLLARKQ